MARTKKSAPGKRKPAEAAAAAAAGRASKKAKHAQPQPQPQPQRAAGGVALRDGDASQRAAEAALTRLLGGMSVGSFLADHFEKMPLHVRNDGSHQLFDKKLFSRKQLLKSVLDKHELGFGRDLTVCRYVDGERENYDGREGSGVATSGAVGSLLDRGFSCQFYQPQRYVDGLFALNAVFETAFGGLAGASAYLTPPNAQALAPHHDDVEVFVLQTEGRKKWKLYRPLVELAGEHSADLSPDEIGEPWMELTLEEGDVLYFPRGVVHQACTDEEQFSTHVTISVYQHNSWANFLEVALPRVIRDAFDADVDFRRGLPVGYLNYVGSQFPGDSEPAAAFAKTVKRLLHKLAGHATASALQAAADEAAMDVVANRLPPTASPSAPSGADVLAPNVSIRFKHPSHVRLVMGSSEDDREPIVAVYYSTQNCRRHHMGLCTCDDGGSDGDEDESEGSEGSDAGDEGKDEGKNGAAASAEGEAEAESDGESEGDTDLDMAAAPEGVPPQPRSIAFPGELAAALMKLYAASSGAGVRVKDLVEGEGDETAVRGMLLRLWSEELLAVTPRK